MVSALLSGKAPIPGGKRSTSCVIHPGKTMGTSLQETNVKNRILVCATTNQAVDSLAWKIKNQVSGLWVVHASCYLHMCLLTDSLSYSSHWEPRAKWVISKW